MLAIICCGKTFREGESSLAVVGELRVLPRATLRAPGAPQAPSGQAESVGGPSQCLQLPCEWGRTALNSTLSAVALKAEQRQKC